MWLACPSWGRILTWSFCSLGKSIIPLSDQGDVSLTDVISGFLWRVLAICSISLIPPYVVKLVRRVMKPPSHRKVQGI
jgi:hypothetical protein